MSSYDQNLLDEAPKATRAQMQEGYNIDLLEQPPRRNPSVRITPPQPPPVLAPIPLAPGAAENGSREKFASPIQPYATTPRKSFWRSRNGIITIIFIAVVIVGAVVGGAVGGTVGKKGKSSNLNGTGSTGDTTSSSPGSTPVGLPLPNSTPAGIPLPTSTSTGTAGGTQGTGGSPTAIAGPINHSLIPISSQVIGNAQPAASNAVAANFSY